MRAVVLILLVLIIITGGVYTGAWFFGASLLKKNISTNLEDSGVAFEEIKLSGFPTKMLLTVKNPEFVKEQNRVKIADDVIVNVGILGQRLNVTTVGSFEAFEGDESIVKIEPTQKKVAQVRLSFEPLTIWKYAVGGRSEKSGNTSFQDEVLSVTKSVKFSFKPARASQGQEELAKWEDMSVKVKFDQPSRADMLHMGIIGDVKSLEVTPLLEQFIAAQDADPSTVVYNVEYQNKVSSYGPTSMDFDLYYKGPRGADSVDSMTSSTPLDLEVRSFNFTSELGDGQGKGLISLEPQLSGLQAPKFAMKFDVKSSYTPKWYEVTVQEVRAEFAKMGAMIDSALSQANGASSDAPIADQSMRIMKQITSYFESNPAKVEQLVPDLHLEGSLDYTMDISVDPAAKKFFVNDVTFSTDKGRRFALSGYFDSTATSSQAPFGGGELKVEWANYPEEVKRSVDAIKGLLDLYEEAITVPEDRLNNFVALPELSDGFSSDLVTLLKALSDEPQSGSNDLSLTVQLASEQGPTIGTLPMMGAMMVWSEFAGKHLPKPDADPATTSGQNNNTGEGTEDSAVSPISSADQPEGANAAEAPLTANALAQTEKPLQATAQQ